MVDSVALLDEITAARLAELDTANIPADIRQFGAGSLVTKTITLSLAAVPVTENLC